MKRVVCAALAAVGLWAAPASAQTFFNATGVITSYETPLTGGFIPTASPFSFVISLHPDQVPYGAPSGFTAADFTISSPVIEFGTKLNVAGAAKVTKVSDLQYYIDARYLTNPVDTDASIGFTLTSPLPVTPGPVSLASSSVTLFSSHSVGTGYITALTTAVPEAGTWAMMVVGLGVIGTAVRRRQAVRVRYALT